MNNSSDSEFSTSETKIPSLIEWMGTEGKDLSLMDRVKLLEPIASAIDDLHVENTYIHQLDPTNIRVWKSEDSGTRFILEPAALQDNHSELQSSIYRFPEILRGEKESAATNAFSFGVILLQVAANDLKLTPLEDWQRRIKNGPLKSLIRKLIKGEPTKRMTDFAIISKAIRRLERKTRLRKTAKYGITVMLSLVILAHAWLFLYQIPVLKNEADEVTQRLREKGIPTNVDEMNQKYPATAESEIAITEAVLIARLMPQEITENNSSAIITKLPDNLPSSEHDVFEQRLNSLSGDVLDFQKITRDPILDDLFRRIERLEQTGPPITELNYFYSYKEEAPWHHQIRDFGETVYTKSDHSKVREPIRNFFPVELSERFRSAEYSIFEAYNLIIAWRYYQYCISSADFNLLNGLINISSQRILHETLLKTLESYPPDKETTRMILQNLSQNHIAMDDEKTIDEDLVLFSRSMYQFMAGERESTPYYFNFLNEKRIRSPAKFFYLIGLRPDEGMTGLRDSFLPLLDPYLIPAGYDSLAVTGRVQEQFAKDLELRTYDESEWEDILQPSIKSNVMLRITEPGWYDGSDTSQYTINREGVIISMLVMRLEELQRGTETYSVPADIKPLFEKFDIEQPEDFLAPAGTLMEYSSDTDLGLYQIRHSLLRRRSGNIFNPFKYWGVWGSRYLKGVVVSKPVEVISEPWMYHNKYEKLPVAAPKLFQLKIKHESGKVIPVLFSALLGDHWNVEENFPVGTPVKVRKRPVQFEDELAFELISTNDLEVLDQE